MASIAERIALGEIGLEGEIEICTMNPLTGRPWQYQKVKNVVCQSMYDYIRLLIKTSLTQTMYYGWYMKGLAPIPELASKASGGSTIYDLKNPAGFLYLTDGLLPEDRFHYVLDGNIVGFGDLSNSASADLKKGMLTPSASYSFCNEVYRRWDFASDRGKGAITKISLARNGTGAYGEEVAINGTSMRYAFNINGEYWICRAVSKTEIRFERIGIEGRNVVNLGDVITSLPDAPITFSTVPTDLYFCYNSTANKVYISSSSITYNSDYDAGLFCMNLDGSECEFIPFSTYHMNRIYGFSSKDNLLMLYTQESYNSKYKVIFDVQENTIVKRESVSDTIAFNNTFEISRKFYAVYGSTLYTIIDDTFALQSVSVGRPIAIGDAKIIDIVGDKAIMASDANGFPIVYSVPADDKHPCNLMTEKLLPEPVVKGDMPMYVGYTLRLV